MEYNVYKLVMIRDSPTEDFTFYIDDPAYSYAVAQAPTLGDGLLSLGDILKVMQSIEDKRE